LFLILGVMDDYYHFTFSLSILYFHLYFKVNLSYDSFIQTRCLKITSA
jgi:hypothetical protein